MPVNYADAKIYKIEPKCAHDEADVYYGSTARLRLCDRYKGHLSDYKQTNKKMTITSRLLFEKYGVENCHIVLVEAFPCTTRDELTARESHFIRTLPCVNKSIPNINAEEHKENAKEYYLTHKAERDEYFKEYNLTHKAEIQAQNQQYQLVHKDDIKAKRKIYRLVHKADIKAKRKIHNDAKKYTF